jgi:hypothetical protein
VLDELVSPTLARIKTASGPVERAVADMTIKHEFLKSRQWAEFRENLRLCFARDRALASIATSLKAARRRAAIDPLLKAQTLSPSAWGKKAGIDPKLPANYLRCETDLRREKREALAAVLGMSPDDIFPD